MEGSREEGDLVTGLREGHDFGLLSVTLVCETDVVVASVLGEANEFHVLFVKFEGCHLVRVGHTLDHNAAQTDVRHQARVVQVDLLRLDLGGTNHSLESLTLLFVGDVKGHDAIGIEVLVCGRLADSHDCRVSFVVIIFILENPAILGIATLRLRENHRRNLATFFTGGVLRIEVELPSGDAIIWLSLHDENLVELADMGVHVEFQVDVTGTVGLTEWPFLLRVEHDHLVLLTLETLDDQGKDHKVTVGRDHKIVLLLELSLGGPIVVLTGGNDGI